MTGFNNLPNEILLAIIDVTSAGDIDSLAKCCRLLKRLARGRLMFHQSKRATIEDVVVDRGSVEASAIHPLIHLQDIIEHDDLRFYTRVMKIGTLGNYEDDRTGTIIANIIFRFGREIEALVAKVYSALFPSVSENVLRREVTRWTDAVKSGRRPSIVILLLALYPNLKILHIYETYQVWWINAENLESEVSVGEEESMEEGSPMEEGESKWREESMGEENSQEFFLRSPLDRCLDLASRFPEVDDAGVSTAKNTKTSKGVPWWDLFNYLIDAARVPATNKMKIFSKISEFEVRGGDDPESEQARAEMFAPFQALPTMRRISAFNLETRNVTWSYGMGTSKVIHLELDGDADRASLSNIISGLGKLERFSYLYYPPLVGWTRGGGERLDRLRWGPRARNDAARTDQDEDKFDKWVLGKEETGKERSCRYDGGWSHRYDGGWWNECDGPWSRWEPRAIAASLAEYACNSLVSLDLTAATFENTADLLRDEPFLDSLRAFQVLKKVRLNTMMLFKRLKYPEPVLVSPGHIAGQTDREEIMAQRLIDFLPKTIEKFVMTCMCVGQGLSEKDVAAMFTGLPKRRNKLPNLSKIKFEGIPQSEERHQSDLDMEKKGWAELYSRCRENEIALCCVHVSRPPRFFGYR